MAETGFFLRCGGKWSGGAGGRKVEGFKEEEAHRSQRTAGGWTIRGDTQGVQWQRLVSLTQSRNLGEGQAAGQEREGGRRKREEEGGGGGGDGGTES